MHFRKLWLIGIAALVIGTTVGVLINTSTEQAAKSGVPDPNFLFVDANIVAGGPGGCVASSHFTTGGLIVFRIKVYNNKTGEALDDTHVNSVNVSIPWLAEPLHAHYGGHGMPTPSDYFWTVSLPITQAIVTNHSGALNYNVVATGFNGRTGTFKEFDVTPSLATIY